MCGAMRCCQVLTKAGIAGIDADSAMCPAQVLLLQHERCWVWLQNREQLLQAAVPPGLRPQGLLRLLP